MNSSSAGVGRSEFPPVITDGTSHRNLHVAQTQPVAVNVFSNPVHHAALASADSTNVGGNVFLEAPPTISQREAPVGTAVPPRNPFLAPPGDDVPLPISE